MRTASEVSEFERKARKRYLAKCPKCGGVNSRCECNIKFNIALQQYIACIPRDFTNIDPKTIKYNKNVFKKVVLKYVKSIKLALRRGYGLVLTGDNGVGKTYFLCYILNEAIKSGSTAYYTTLLQAEYFISSGFDDRSIRERLDWMMTSDFLVLDEIGKEKRKSNERTYMDTQVERILKQRYDTAHPVLMATNLSIEGLKKSYGSTIGSMIAGKSKVVQMAPGDFRLELGKKMNKDMGY